MILYPRHKLFLVSLMNTILLSVALNCGITQETKIQSVDRPAPHANLTVYSPDPFVAGSVRRSLSRIFNIREADSLSCRGKGRGYELVVSAEIYDSSLDLLQNALFSLLSMTTYAAVSSSAQIKLNYTFFYNGRRVASETHVTTGRIGSWAVLPPWAGLMATLMGTALNSYRLPENLKAACFNENVFDKEKK